MYRFIQTMQRLYPWWLMLLGVGTCIPSLVAQWKYNFGQIQWWGYLLVFLLGANVFRMGWRLIKEQYQQ